MAGNIYSEDWQKKNMKGITVKYKTGFVEEFKDACDNCGKFNYCKGYKGKVLCEECIKKEEKNNG